MHDNQISIGGDTLYKILTYLSFTLGAPDSHSKRLRFGEKGKASSEQSWTTWPQLLGRKLVYPACPILLACSQYQYSLTLLVSTLVLGYYSLSFTLFFFYYWPHTKENATQVCACEGHCKFSVALVAVSSWAAWQASSLKDRQLYCNQNFFKVPSWIVFFFFSAKGEKGGNIYLLKTEKAGLISK